jgi:hypothetical protein
LISDFFLLIVLNCNSNDVAGCNGDKGNEKLGIKLKRKEEEKKAKLQ